jgi:hypothetical protein
MESIGSIVKSQVSYLGKKNIFYLKIIILVFIFIFKISILKLSKIFKKNINLIFFKNK